MAEPTTGTAAAAGTGCALMLIPIIICGIAIALITFWILMLIHCIKHQKKDRVMWIMILIFLNWIGAIIYFKFRDIPNQPSVK